MTHGTPGQVVYSGSFHLAHRGQFSVPSHTPSPWPGKVLPTSNPPSFPTVDSSAKLKTDSLPVKMRLPVLVLEGRKEGSLCRGGQDGSALTADSSVQEKQF